MVLLTKMAINLPGYLKEAYGAPVEKHWVNATLNTAVVRRYFPGRKYLALIEVIFQGSKLFPLGSKLFPLGSM